MSDRNSKGQFVNGHIEDAITRQKRLASLKEAARKRDSYLGELQQHPLYNIWRAFRFTKKGKKAGNSEEWNSFKTFYSDVLPFYEEGKRFNRQDVTKPFSKDNFIFLTEEEAACRRRVVRLLTYKGQTKSLEEWVIDLDLNESGVKQRYYRGKRHGHSAERILFGVKYGPAKEVKDFRELEAQQIRAKASKMISAYNNKDKKRGFEKSDLTIEWVIENIFNAECTYCGDTKRLGADRLDNSRNHDMDNVVPCCFECNVARSDNFSHEEMKVIGQAVRAVKESRA